jgi:hypothetical protein
MTFYKTLVAGQPQFESMDCLPQMKIRMISVILCGNYFVFLGIEHLNFMLTSGTESENVHFVFYNFVM